MNDKGYPGEIAEPAFVLEQLMAGTSKQTLLLYLARWVTKTPNLESWYAQGMYHCAICNGVFVRSSEHLKAHQQLHIDDLLAGKFKKMKP